MCNLSQSRWKPLKDWISKFKVSMKTLCKDSVIFCLKSVALIAWVEVGRNLRKNSFSSILETEQRLGTGRYFLKSLWSRQLFLIIGVTRAYLKNYEKMPDAKEELNGSVRKGKIELIDSLMSLEEIGSRSHDLRAEKKNAFIHCWL